MEQIILKATLRDSRGKEAAKKMRKQGFVPGIVYHRGEEPISIALVNRELVKILNSHENENILINLTIEKEKKKSRAVLIKEVQHDPVRRNILHVDFNEISLTETITVEVEIVAKGESIGVKQDGGFLEIPLRHVKIECLPTDIPGHIDVDVSNLKLNDTVHVKDIPQNPKIKILTDPETLLFQVKKIEAVVEEAEPGTTPELEVIREKKEEEGASSSGGKAEAKEEPKSTGKPEKK